MFGFGILDLGAPIHTNPGLFMLQQEEVAQEMAGSLMEASPTLAGTLNPKP